MNPPDANPIVLFDGDCLLCNASVRFILQHDRAGIFQFFSLQSEIGHEIVARYQIDPKTTDTVVLVAQNRAFIRSTAVMRILALLGGDLELLADLLAVIPTELRDCIYSFVARNRYRWFNRRETCASPRPRLTK